MGLLKKLTSAFVAGSLVLSLVGTASAAFDSTSAIAAAQHMKELGIIQGRPDGDLGLNDTITRAELATILVRAFGQDANAALLKGAPSFPDVSASHWASGYVFIASNIATKSGNPLGYPDGSFQPDGKVTQAEAIAFSMKFLGVSPVAALAWPLNYLQGAVNASLLSEADMNALVASAGAEAKRNLVFYIVDNGFQTYKLPSGKTVYQTYVDSIGPVVTVENINDGNTTSAASVTVKGTVKDGTTSISDMVTLTVGGKAVTADANGNWSTTVAVDQLGANTVTASATDLAGNMGTASLTVTRVAGAAATIEASASATTLAAGATADLTVSVMDENGMETADTPSFTATGAVTVDADGKVTAATTPGTGAVTVAAGDVTATVDFTVTAGPLAKLTPSATSVAKGTKVTMTAADSYGNAISSGVTYSVDSANAVVDPTTGALIASAEGTYTVTAKSGDVSVTAKVGVYGTSSKLSISAPASVVGNYNALDTATPGTAAEVTVSVVDANGNVNAAAIDAVTLAGAGVTIMGKTSGTATESAVNGVATFKVYAPVTLAGANITLSATAGALTSSSNPALAIDAQTATKVTVSLSKYIATNAANSKAVTVKVLDQKDVPMRAATYVAKVTLSGVGSLASGSSQTSKDVSVVNGSNAAESVYVGQGITGTATVTATVDGVGTASATSTAVIAGSATQLVATVDKAAVKAGAAVADAAKVSFTVTDANGIPVQGPDPLLAIDLSALDSTAGLAVTDPNNGNANLIGAATGPVRAADDSYALNVTTTAAFTGDVPIKVSATGTNTVTATVTVNAGDYTAIGLTRTTPISVPVANPTATVTAQLYDAMGNAVKAAGVKVTAVGAETSGGAASSEVTLNGTTKTVDATTDADGKATFTVTTRPFATADYFVAVSGKQADGTTALGTVGGGSVEATINVATVATQSIKVEMLKDVGTSTFTLASYVNAGDSVMIRATVTDSYGAARTGIAGTLSVSAEKIFWVGGALSSTAGALTETAPGSGIYESAPLTIGKAGLNSITVKDTGGSSDVSNSASLLVNAGTVASVTVSGVTANTIKPTTNTVAGPYTVQLTDAYGNAVSSNANTTINVSYGNAASASVRQSVDGTTVTTLSTRSTSTIYVAASADTTVTFDLDGNLGTTTDQYVLTVDVQ